MISRATSCHKGANPGPRLAVYEFGERAAHAVCAALHDWRTRRGLRVVLHGDFVP